MTKMTSLDSILGRKASPAAPVGPATTKTASDGSLDAALEQVLDRASAEKTASASAPDPMATMAKMASDMAEKDHDADIKKAHLTGRAMGAGFIAELNDYSAAAANLNEKAASAVSDEDLALLKMAKENPAQFLALVQQSAASSKTAEQIELEKWAHADPAGFEAAVKAGYESQRTEQDKAAAEGFQAGYNAEVNRLHKQAAVHFAMGFDAVNEALAEIGK